MRAASKASSVSETQLSIHFHPEEDMNGFSIVQLANKTNELNLTVASVVGPQLEGIIEHYSPLESSTSPTGSYGTPANNATAHFFVALVSFNIFDRVIRQYSRSQIMHCCCWILR